MPVFYKAAAIKSHFDPENKVRFHARPANTKKVDTDYLCKYISMRCTASQADIRLVVAALRDAIPELLLDNHTVHLENFGIFSLSLKSKVEDTPDQITYRSVEKVNLNFRPTVAMKKQLQSATIRKA